MNRYEIAMSWKSSGKNMAIGVACLMLCPLGSGVVNGQEIEMLGSPAFAVQQECPPACPLEENWSEG